MPIGDPVCILDLATGTGANIRYLIERLPRRQRWLAVDRSAALLAELREQMVSWATARGYDAQSDTAQCVMRGAQLDCHLETREIDLGALDNHEIFARRHLVTASALLDLVSAQWLRQLAEHCRIEGASVLLALTYNGRSSCDPVEPEDDTVRDLLNAHQKTDKGLGGPAAGPDASDCAARALEEAGYRVRRDASDWTLAPAQADMQRKLVDGWAQAAAEMAPNLVSTLARWKKRRLAHVEAGHSRVTVGHDDLAAWATLDVLKGQKSTK